MSTINHCLACGACCAFYRASFYWAEGDDVSENGVPVALTEKMNDFRRMMRGTGSARPWCVALKGVIGKRVHCAIYEQRASVCRQFEPAWHDNLPNEWCDKARRAWGLVPLQPGCWPRNDDFPKAA